MRGDAEVTLKLDGSLVNKFLINFAISFICFGFITSGYGNSHILADILVWVGFVFCTITCLGLFYLVHKSLCDIVNDKYSKISVDDEEE